MPMANAPLPDANFKLVPNEPAYLEVTVDPAAHGEAGLGPLTRRVTMQTAGGQQFSFDLTGVIVH